MYVAGCCHSYTSGPCFVLPSSLNNGLILGACNSYNITLQGLASRCTASCWAQDTAQSTDVYLLQIALANLDSVLLEARGVLEGISPHLLAEMEDVQKAQFEPASPVPEGTSLMMQRLLSRRPTAAPTHEGMVRPHAQERSTVPVQEQ